MNTCQRSALPALALLLTAAATASAQAPAAQITCPHGTKLAVNPAQHSQTCKRPDGQNHGPTMDTYPDGAVRTSGRYRHGREVGGWKTYYKDGTLKSAVVYRNGRRHGRARTYHPNGKLESQGNHGPPSGNRTGLWAEWRSDGTLESRQSYADGLRSGPATTYHSDGKTRMAQGYYRIWRKSYEKNEGVKHGRWRTWDERGALLSDGHYSWDRKTGKWRQRSSADKAFVVVKHPRFSRKPVERGPDGLIRGF